MAQQTLIKGKLQLVDLPDIDLGKIKEKLETVIDSVVEYPGSRKGDSGRWVLTEWVDAKIGEVVSKSRTERE